MFFDLIYSYFKLKIIIWMCFFSIKVAVVICIHFMLGQVSAFVGMLEHVTSVYQVLPVPPHSNDLITADEMWKQQSCGWLTRSLKGTVQTCSTAQYRSTSSDEFCNQKYTGRSCWISGFKLRSRVVSDENIKIYVSIIMKKKYSGKVELASLSTKIWHSKVKSFMEYQTE